MPVAGDWTLTESVLPARWIVYLGKLPDAEALQRRQRLVGEGAACFPADHRGADAAVDGERRAQRGPEHLRLADQVDHLCAGPQVVGAGLHRD